MPHYILTRMSAHFFTELQQSSCVSSSDIEINDYLKAERRLQNFILRPIVVERNRRVVPNPEVVNFNFSNETMLVGFSPLDSRYEIEVLSQDYPSERILDVLDAARAFITRNTERNLALLLCDTNEHQPSRIMTTEDFIRICAVQFDSHPDQVRYSGVLDGFTYGTAIDALIWQLADTIYQNDVLVYGLLFFREAMYSLENIFAVPSSSNSSSDSPLSISESVKLENALHNFYKAVEAAYGGTLANDDSKIHKKFFQKGIDTSAILEFPHSSGVKASVFNRIRGLQAARDDRAAHGRVHANRMGTYSEVMDSMELAHYIMSKLIAANTSIDPLEHPNLVASFTNS